MTQYAWALKKLWALKQQPRHEGFPARILGLSKIFLISWLPALFLKKVYIHLSDFSCNEIILLPPSSHQGLSYIYIYIYIYMISHNVFLLVLD
jgi:hypothetical protein